MPIYCTSVYGFNHAIQAMRNPMNSWQKSDSILLCENDKIPDRYEGNLEYFVLGEEDKKLSQKLSKAGAEHRKHLRQIQVWTQFEFPRYVWQEIDTYKHIEKISCSTMHTLMKQAITKDMFDEEDVDEHILNQLNELRCSYLDAKEQNNIILANQLLIEAKRKLPEGFIQQRSINTNYECLLNMYWQRKNHKLPYWHTICDWILLLPYFKQLTGVEE
jgi:hypothetical protein